MKKPPQAAPSVSPAKRVTDGEEEQGSKMRDTR